LTKVGDSALSTDLSDEDWGDVGSDAASPPSLCGVVSTAAVVDALMRVDRLVGMSLDGFGDSGGGGDAVTLLFRLPPPALLQGMIANLDNG
jgi:hypothetical protein